jgi:competence protein ComEA
MQRDPSMTSEPGANAAPAPPNEAPSSRDGAAASPRAPGSPAPPAPTAALVERVPHIEAARAVLRAVIALTAGWRAMSPTPLPPLGAVLDHGSGTCVLGVVDSRPPCPCADTPAGLRRALGIPLPLDRASAADLERIPGVGPRRAEGIVAERLRSGAYASPAALERVPGIGAKTAAALAPYLFTGAVDPACGTGDGPQSQALPASQMHGAPPLDLTADVPAPAHSAGEDLAP